MRSLSALLFLSRGAVRDAQVAPSDLDFTSTVRSATFDLATPRCCRCGAGPSRCLLRFELSCMVLFEPVHGGGGIALVRPLPGWYLRHRYRIYDNQSCAGRRPDKSPD